MTGLILHRNQASCGAKSGEDQDQAIPGVIRRECSVPQDQVISTNWNADRHPMTAPTNIRGCLAKIGHGIYREPGRAVF